MSNNQYEVQSLEQLIDMQQYVRELRAKEQSQIYQKNIKFNPFKRDKLVCWIIQHCDNQPEISQKSKEVTVQLIDLYLNVYQLQPQHYQLLALSSLQIAIKAHERWSYRIIDLVQQCDGLYTENDFENIELELLRLIRWNCIRISPSDYSDLIWELYLKFTFDPQSKGYIQKIIDVSISSYEFYHFEPSIIAIGSIIYIIRSVIQSPQSELQFRESLQNSNEVFQFDFDQIDLFLTTIESIMEPQPIEQEENQNVFLYNQNPQQMIMEGDHSTENDEVDLSTNQTFDNQNNENSVASSNANFENDNLLQFDNSPHNSINNNITNNIAICSGHLVQLNIQQLQYQQQSFPLKVQTSQMQQSDLQAPGSPESKPFYKTGDFLEELNKDGDVQAKIFFNSKSQNEEFLMQSQETNTSQSLMYSASKQSQLDELCPNQDNSFYFDY